MQLAGASRAMGDYADVVSKVNYLGATGRVSLPNPKPAAPSLPAQVRSPMLIPYYGYLSTTFFTFFLGRAMGAPPSPGHKGRYAGVFGLAYCRVRVRVRGRV